MKLVLICVETNSKANTDRIYINKAIKYFYENNNEISIKYKYLNSKSNYANLKLLKEIKADVKIVGIENTTVLFCVDTDEFDINPLDKKLNKEIEEYCKKNGFRFTWFCKNVEEVFLHKKVDHNEKLKESRRFNSIEGIGRATENDLKSHTFNNRKSNLLNNLDDVLKRKL